MPWAQGTDNIERYFRLTGSNQLQLAERWPPAIGVVGDVLHEGLDGAAKAEMYVLLRDESASIQLDFRMA